MARQHRQVPALQALMQGMTEAQIAELQEICDAFENNYDELMAYLQSLGAQREHFREVNAQARKSMGKPREQADLLNRVEMLTWSVGYGICLKTIEGLTQLSADTRKAFLEAARRANRDDQ